MPNYRICAPVAKMEESLVDSEKDNCVNCNEEVWRDKLADTDDQRTLCLYCAKSLLNVKPMDVGVDDETRQAINEMGVSDEDIDDAMDLVNETMNDE